MPEAAYAPAIEPDGLYEVVDGVVVEKTNVGARELWLANVLGGLLKALPGAAEAGQVLVEMIYDFRPALNHERRPDVSFVSFARWPQDRAVPFTAAWPVVPELAVEIVSPSNGAADVRRKIREYFRAGVARVWVVYPETEEVEDYDGPASVRILRSADSLDLGALIPGARLDLAHLFPAD